MEKKQEQGYTAEQLAGFARASDLRRTAEDLKRRAAELITAADGVHTAVVNGDIGAVEAIFKKATAPTPDGLDRAAPLAYRSIVQKLNQRLRMTKEADVLLAALKTERPDEYGAIGAAATKAREHRETLNAYIVEADRKRTTFEEHVSEYLTPYRRSLEQAKQALSEAEARLDKIKGEFQTEVKGAKKTIDEARSLAVQKNPSLNVPGGVDVVAALMGRKTFSAAPVPVTDKPAPAQAANSIFNLFRGGK